MQASVIAGAVVASLLSAQVAAKEWTHIRFGVEGAYPPFSYTQPDGTVAGFDVELAHAICEQLNARCELVAQDWDGIIPALLARKYDAIIAAMSITAERERSVSFTDKYAKIPNRFVVAKDAALDLSPDGIKGKRIGVQRASTNDKFLSDSYGSGVTIVRYGSADEAYLDLRAGRLDAVLNDASATQQGLLDKEGGDRFEFRGPEFTDEKWFGRGMGIAVRKQDNELREQLNGALRALRDNGTYQRINAKYFEYSIYGD
ncbi:ABC transporter substrate-binding protein [Zobellella denitrificans]|jgi:arginine/ornithine transport system substrate-binding protein